MKHIIKNLHTRGLTLTAVNLEREIQINDINPDAIIANKERLIAFANKLSMQEDPKLKVHAKVLLNIVDSVSK